MDTDESNELLTKDATALLLGISTRAVARHAERERLTPIYHKRDGGGERVYYHAAEVERLRNSLTVPRTRSTGTNHDAMTARSVRASELAQVVAAAVHAALPPAARVPVEARLLLTLPECESLTGLSVDYLEQRRRAGELRAVDVDGQVRVSRHDLERFVRIITKPTKTKTKRSKRS